MTSGHFFSHVSPVLMLLPELLALVLFSLVPAIRTIQMSLRGPDPARLPTVDTQVATTGAVLHVYERAGDLRYGEVEVGQETVVFDSGTAGR